MSRLYQAKYKEQFLESINTIELYRWLFDKTYEFEAKFGKDLFDFNKNQLLEFLNTRENHIRVLVTYISYIKTYIEWASKNNLRSLSSNPTLEISKEELEKIAKPESSVIHVDIIYEIVGRNPSKRSIPPLKNAQDQLLVYLIFLGVGGNGAKELINLKESHIDRENMLIKLSEIDPSRIDLPIDDFAISLIDRALSELEYRRYISDDAEGSNIKEEYMIEDGYGYIFRKSNGGRKTEKETITHQGIMARLSKMSKHTGEKLTLNHIRNSGITYITKLLQDNKVDVRISHPAVINSIFKRFDIDKEQRQYSVLQKAKENVEEVYRD